MRLLLDTHVFLWCTKNDRRLSKTAQAKILHASCMSAVHLYLSPFAEPNSVILGGEEGAHAEQRLLCQDVEDVSRRLVA